MGQAASYTPGETRARPVGRWSSLTTASPDGKMPPREGPPMDRRGSRLSRRAFVVGTAGLGLVAGCGRLPWQAPPKVPRIGYLTGTVSASALYEPFWQGLGEYGYVEG